MIKRLGVVSAFAIPIVSLAIFELATWTPPVHEVHTPGAIAVKASFLGSSPSHGSAPKPTTSLSQLRCEVLQSSGMAPACVPGVIERVWPAAAQQPNKLYVGLESGGAPSSNPSGWNIEYNPSSRKLTIHNYESRALLVLQRPDETPGAAVQESIDLMVVATDSISQGTITVVIDSRIERLLGDQATGTYLLGTVMIP